MRIFLTIFAIGLSFSLAAEMNGEANAPARFFHSHNLNSFAMDNREIWKDVVGYEGYYEVSNIGLVRSKYRFVNSVKSQRICKQKILSSGIASNGYLTVSLWKNGKGKTKTIHSLVAESFLNHNPNGFKLVVNHKDFNKKNNHVSNLEIVTNRENTNMIHINSTSKYTGVSWVKNKNRWRTRICINGKNKSLGSFKNEYDAHLAYQNKLKEIINV